MKTQWRVYKAEQPHYYDVYKQDRVSKKWKWLDIVKALNEQEALGSVINKGNNHDY